MKRRFLRTLTLRLLGTGLAASLLLFIAIEVSIAGGYRTVLFPQGFNPANERDQQIAEEFHLDDPVVVRFGHWVVEAARGDFGRSTRDGTPVVDVISHRFSISLELALTGMLLAVAAGVPLGLLAAATDGRPAGRFLSALVGAAQSVPAFMAATVGIWLFAVELGWFRASGWTRLSDSVSGNLGGLILPATVLALAEVGVIARVVRADVVTVLREDFVVAAIGKGMRTRYVLFRHALRPGSLGLLTVLSLNVSSMIAGAFVVEIVFGIGALGQVLVEASLARDLYVLLGITIYTTVIYVFVTSLIDLVLFWADPRIRREF